MLSNDELIVDAINNLSDSVNTRIDDLITVQKAANERQAELIASHRSDYKWIRNTVLTLVGSVATLFGYHGVKGDF